MCYFCAAGGYVDIIDQEPSASASAGGVTSAAGSVACAGLFEEMAKKVANTPDLAEKIKAIFLWNINKNKSLAVQWSKYQISTFVLYSNKKYHNEIRN